MHEINITELRNHLPKYLSDVNKGDEILVTLHGKVIARILPPVNKRQEAKRKLKSVVPLNPVPAHCLSYYVL